MLDLAFRGHGDYIQTDAFEHGCASCWIGSGCRPTCNNVLGSCALALPSLDSHGSERVLLRNHDPNARAYFDGWARVAFLGFETSCVLCAAESDRASGSLRGPLACSRENESCPTVRRRPCRRPITKTRLDRTLQRLAAATHWTRPGFRAGIAQLHGSVGYRGQHGRWWLPRHWLRLW